MASTKTQPVLEQLQQFISNADKGGPRNLWLVDDTMEVYVRKGLHRLRSPKHEINQNATCLDIANVNVATPGQGVFTQFINKAIQINPWDVTRIENIESARWVAHLLRNHWIHSLGTYPCSVFKLKEHT